MKTTSYSTYFLMLAATILTLTACSTVNKPIKNHVSSYDLSKLKQDESKLPSIVYANSSSPSLSSYKQFIIDPVAVNKSAPSIKKLDPNTVADMQQYLHESVAAELRAAGHSIVATADKDTLRISFTISDLKIPSAALNLSNIIIPVSASVGDVTVETVFRESQGDRINTIVITRAAGARILNKSPWSTKADIKSAFDKWAKDIRDALITG